MSKELMTEEFLEALGEGCYSAIVPSEGFKLINAGEPLETMPLFGNRLQMALKITLPLQKGGFVALPFNKEGHDLEEAIKDVQGKEIKLLCPVGELLSVKRDFFDGDVPLFQQFANLADEDEMLDFASRHGSLYSKITVLESLSPNGGAVYLESISDWYDEINLVKTALKLIEIYENRSWAKDLKVIESGVVGALYGIEGTSFCVEGPPPKATGKVDEAIFRLLLVMFFNDKLRRHQTTVGYGLDRAGGFISAIYPSSLASAIWLQLAQSFFGDAPNERMAKRCFICGQYGNKASMRKRSKGEFKGRYYHISCYAIFKQQKYRERTAKKEKRTFRGRRRKQFLVDSL